MNFTIVIFMLLNALSVIGYVVFSIKHSRAPYYARRYYGRYEESYSVPNTEFEGISAVCLLGALVFGVLLGIKMYAAQLHWGMWYLFAAIATLMIGTLIDKKIEDKVSVVMLSIIAAIITLCVFYTC